MNDNNSLAHTKWNCKYHIVFAPKYRRKLFYGENRKEIGGILRQLSEWKGVKIVEAEVCPDHIHMLVEIPPKMSVAGYIGFLKGVPFPVSWTVKMKKKQKETQDILSYHTQAAGCSDKARAKASGGRQPIEECGRTGL